MWKQIRKTNRTKIGKNRFSRGGKKVGNHPQRVATGGMRGCFSFVEELRISISAFFLPFYDERKLERGKGSLIVSVGERDGKVAIGETQSWLLLKSMT